jgi:hypothetical protein
LEIARKLVECIGNPEISSIPCLKLFKGTIKDQSDRTAYTPTSYPNSGGYPAGGGQTAYGGGVNGVSALRNRNAGAAAQGQGQGASDPQNTEEGEEDKPVELTLQGLLNALLQENDLVGQLLLDLGNYCRATALHVAELELASEGAVLDRKKVHVKESAYSHHDEVDERLGFLKFIA